MKDFNEKYQPDYDGFFSMIEHMGDDLNRHKDRFDKADVIELGFCSAVSDKLKWTDTFGCDLEDSKENIKFEFKSQKHCLYTEKGNNLKSKKTSTIKLTNTLQNGDNKTLKCTSDWLVLIDTGNTGTYSMAIISYKEVIEKYTKEIKDGFTCQIPMDKLTFLIKPEAIKISTPTAAPNYKKLKQALQKEYTSSFFNKRDK
jgi:hypothetical protein